MSRLQITVACLYLTTVSLVTAGHRDVVFTVELSWNYRVDVVFSWAKFKEFLECICETKRQRCEAQYDSQNDSQVTSVKPDKGENTIPDGDSRHMYYYQCLVEYWHHRLVCWLEQTAPSCRSTNNKTKLQAFRVDNDSCDSLCVGLIWYYYYVSVVFYKTDSNFEFFPDPCECPSSLKTSSTQLQATSTTSTTPSFPAFATAHSKSDSGSEEDTPLGFIVGVTTVVILIAVIVPFLVLFIRKRKQKQNTPNHENESTNVLVLNDINSISSGPQNGHTGTNCVSPTGINCVSPTGINCVSPTGINCVSPKGIHCVSPTGINCVSPTGINCVSPTGINCVAPTGINCASPTGINCVAPIGINCVAPTGINCVSSTGINCVSPKGIHCVSPTGINCVSPTGINCVSPTGINCVAPTGINCASPTGINCVAPIGINCVAPTGINCVSSTGINCVSPYAVHSLSFNFGRGEGISGAVTDNITCLHQYTKVNNDSSANETNAETLFAVLQHSSVTIENKSTENGGKKIKTPHGWASQNSDEKTQDTHEGQNIYRRLQNPHNTSLHHNQGNTTRHMSLSGSAHIPQTANQLSRYSFARPIFNAVSNESADNKIEVTGDALSANHTYYLLDVSVEQVWDGEEQNSGTSEHRQNIYFDLEKREDIFCSDVES